MENHYGPLKKTEYLKMGFKEYPNGIFKKYYNQYRKEFIIASPLFNMGEEARTFIEVEIKQNIHSAFVFIEVKEYDLFGEDRKLENTYEFRGYIRRTRDLRIILNSMKQYEFDSDEDGKFY